MEAHMSIFCNFENEAYERWHFVTHKSGVIIHVLTSTEGHTLDGWAATFEAELKNGIWVQKAGNRVRIFEPKIDVAEWN